MIYRIVAFVTLALSCSGANSQSQWIATLIAGMPEHHCSEARGTQDGKALVCMVWDNDPEKFSEPRQLEVYQNGQLIVTIQPGAPIRQWHFWKTGDQLSIHTGVRGEAGTYQLYDTTTGKLVDEVNSPSSLSKLPQWAKDRAQLDDESVQESPAFSQQRTKWIAKVLRQIDSIHAGMTRRDLQSTFTTEGGISTRTQQTFVYKDCPYIKVNVVFSVTGATEAGDRIVSISQPYLALAVTD